MILLPSLHGRSFAILNPTNAAYSFQWRCEQQEERKTAPAFVCFTERGLLRPEKKIEVRAQKGTHIQWLNTVLEF